MKKIIVSNSPGDINVKVGADIEFMAKYHGEYVYPAIQQEGITIVDDGEIVVKNKKNNDALHLPSDDAGHCVEIRPEPAKNGEGLVLNIIKSMAELPKTFSYHCENTHIMDKKAAFKIIVAVGGKNIADSHNLYPHNDIDDCELDIEARQNGKRLYFCGCHFHISAYKTVDIVDEHDIESAKVDIELPAELLVYLLDRFVFSKLETDDNFNIGRYRERGFYKENFNAYNGGTLEYRSLGSSAMTPKRVRLIADIIIELVKFVISNRNILMAYGHLPGDAEVYYPAVPEKVIQLSNKLGKTKPFSSNVNIRNKWVIYE